MKHREENMAFQLCNMPRNETYHCNSCKINATEHNSANFCAMLKLLASLSGRDQNIKDVVLETAQQAKQQVSQQPAESANTTVITATQATNANLIQDDAQFPLLVAGFSHDIWNVIFQFCTVTSIAQSCISLNKTLFHVIAKHHDAYKLDYCLNAFTRSPFSTVSPTFNSEHVCHFMVPSLNYVQQNSHKLRSMLRLKKLDSARANMVSTTVQPSYHSVWTFVLLQAPKYVSEAQAQDVLVLIMTYLPWHYAKLLNHPFAKVRAMAQVGAKIYDEFGEHNKASGNAVERAKQIASNYEDYSNCILYDLYKDIYGGSFSILGYKFQIVDDQTLLSLLRAGGYITTYEHTTTNLECITYLLQNPTYHKMINPQVFHSKKFAALVLTHYHGQYQYAPEVFKKNEFIIGYAVELHKYQILLHTSVELQMKYSSQYITAIVNPANKMLVRGISMIAPEYKDDEEIISAFSSINGLLFAQASLRIQNMEHLAAKAVEQNYFVFKKLPIAIQNKLPVLRALLKHSLDHIETLDAEVIDLYDETKQVQQCYEQFLAEAPSISFTKFVNQQNIVLAILQ